VIKLVLILALGSALLLTASAPAAAHDFPAPSVAVTVSTVAPGTHPTLRVLINAPTGPGFDQIRIVSPSGSRIARDSDITDHTRVGQLDGEATTNAITRATCDIPTKFSVPIVEETADPASPAYPDYLRRLAPDQHQLRLVADVSPSPDIPILINYLFDIDPATDGVVSQVFIGDPDDPPSQFRWCTPLKFTNTLFGVVGRTPLLTAPPALPEGGAPFRFTFTSRADADGHRHAAGVDVRATVDTSLAPSLAPPDREGPRAPFGQDLIFLGPLVRFVWQTNEVVESFEIEILEIGEPHTIIVARFSVAGDQRSFDLPDELEPRCGGRRFIYRIAGVQASGRGESAELRSPNVCVDSPDNRQRASIRVPDTGAGDAKQRSYAGSVLTLTLLGAASVVFGAAKLLRASAVKTDLATTDYCLLGADCLRPRHLRQLREQLLRRDDVPVHPHLARVDAQRQTDHLRQMDDRQVDVVLRHLLRRRLLRVEVQVAQRARRHQRVRAQLLRLVDMAARLL
jgi:hypothetical protein